jgi:solute carrier family 45 protein 1/2/4
LVPGLQADFGTKERRLYDDGVRFGCWGMAMYSLSCSCYSFIIERLVKRFRFKKRQFEKTPSESSF